MGKRMIKILFNVLFLLSCNSYESSFEALISSKDINNFPSVNLEGIENINNHYYKEIYLSGTKANNYLIKKLNSNKQTKWTIAGMPYLLTEGDIALKLLIDINKIDFNKLIPEEISNDYRFEGAIVWWHWLHKSDENKNYIIRIIKQEIAVSY